MPGSCFGVSYSKHNFLNFESKNTYKEDKIEHLHKKLNKNKIFGKNYKAKMVLTKYKISLLTQSLNQKVEF